MEEGAVVAQQCAARQLAPSAVDGLDSRSSPDKEAIGNKAERSDVDEAPALVDQLRKLAVDVGVFPETRRSLLGTVHEELRAPAFEPKLGSFGSDDIDRPLFVVAPAKIEAHVEPSIGRSAAHLDRGGGRRLWMLLQLNHGGPTDMC